MAVRVNVFGFPLRVEASFFLLLIFYSSGGAEPQVILATFACTFVGILWHELGHAFVARRFGATPSITLYWRGGLTHTPVPEGRSPLTWKHDVAISVAGPLAGFLLGGLVWLLSRAAPPESEMGNLVVHRLLWINLGWGALNLLPLQPWDGGLATRALFVRLWPRRGESVADVLTIALGSVLALAAIVSGWYWAAYLAGIGPIDAVGRLQRTRQARAVDDAWNAWDEGRVSDARAIGQTLARRGVNDDLRARGLEIVIFTALRSCDAEAAKVARAGFPTTMRPSSLLAAIIACDAQDFDTASKLFRDAPAGLLDRVFLPIVEAWLREGWRERLEMFGEQDALQLLPRDVVAAVAERAFYARAYDLSRRLGEGLFAAHRTPDDGYNVACTLAQVGDVETALDWLSKAIDAGYTDVGHLVADADLEPVRASERYVLLVERLRGSNGEGQVAAS